MDYKKLWVELMKWLDEQEEGVEFMAEYISQEMKNNELKMAREDDNDGQGKDD